MIDDDVSRVQFVRLLGDGRLVSFVVVPIVYRVRPLSMIPSPKPVTSTDFCFTPDVSDVTTNVCVCVCVCCVRVWKVAVWCCGVDVVVVFAVDVEVLDDVRLFL